MIEAVSDSMEVSPTMVAMAALGTLSLVVGAKCEVHPLGHNGWVERCLLYIMAVLPPGNNKTQILNSFLKVAKEWAKQRFEFDKAQLAMEKSRRKILKADYERKMRQRNNAKTDEATRARLTEELQKLDMELEKPLRKPFCLMLDDVTGESLAEGVYEQQNVLGIVSDEAGVIETLTGLYTKGSANTDILLKGYDGGDVRVKRQHREYDLNPTLTVLLLFQPKVLSRVREHIYCEAQSLEHKMQGILIYTAAGDSEGTMGGLVRQGEAGRLEKIIQRALQDAMWCGADPICIESPGQGTGNSNLAACHNCCLLPETSCEQGNRFLDRSLLVGLPEDRTKGFFHPLLISKKS